MDEKKKDLFVNRVTQLDAVQLDNEVMTVLKQQLTKAFKYTSPGLLGKWEPEIEAVLRFIIWKFSVQKCYATFGQQLLGVKYRGTQNSYKVLAYAFLLVLPKWIQDRSVEIGHCFREPDTKQKVKQFIHWLEVTIEVSAIVNFLVFLRQGRYPTLLDRLLRLQPVSAFPGQTRTVGYSYLIRELMWHSFIELLVFTLPLINFHRVKGFVTRLFAKSNSSVRNNPIPLLRVETKCAVCLEYPVLPHHIGCGHIFCFYCAKANFMADPKFLCPVCHHLPSSGEDDLKPVMM